MRTHDWSLAHDSQLLGSQTSISDRTVTGQCRRSATELGQDDWRIVQSKDILSQVQSKGVKVRSDIIGINRPGLRRPHHRASSRRAPSSVLMLAPSSKLGYDGPRRCRAAFRSTNINLKLKRWARPGRAIGNKQRPFKLPHGLVCKATSARESAPQSHRSRLRGINNKNIPGAVPGLVLYN